MAGINMAQLTGTSSVKASSTAKRARLRRIPQKSQAALSRPKARSRQPAKQITLIRQTTPTRLPESRKRQRSRGKPRTKNQPKTLQRSRQPSAR